jgi:aryl-alcohol dehydrogenase-like predicted oxidoreductase
MDDVAETLYGSADDPVLHALADLSDATGIPAAQLALAWMWTRPAVAAPVVGATSIRHIEDAIAASELRLPPGTFDSVENAYGVRALTDLPMNARNQTVLGPGQR